VKIAAIITNYNYADRVGLAIDSVKRQTSPPDTIVVVDDWSTDNSMQSYRPYADDIELYQTREQSGPSTAKNVGVVNSPNDTNLLAFLDADDTYHPEFIKDALVYFKAYPDLAIVYSDCIEHNHTTDITKVLYREPFAVERHVVQDTIGGNFIVRKDVLEAVGGFDPSLPVLENYDLTRRIVRHFTAIHIPKPLVNSWVSHRCLRQKAPARDWENALQKIYAKN
jgi:glycosyltransferase involved in cell wall biosynthesis